ncbi:MAG: hypothetical protein NVSMB20_20750 [Bradyrhizobium sp.]
MAGEDRILAGGARYIDFQTDPSRYRHWKLAVDGEVATLTMDVDENGGLFEGYQLKLNSYDLGVDIELADAVQRLRFEHPGVKVVVLRSAKNRVFCAGANIRMLAGATHAHKVNFCKFTNETRNGLEDSSRHDGLKSVASVTGACAGGGYELALAIPDSVTSPSSTARRRGAATNSHWPPITSSSPMTALLRWRCRKCRFWRCCRAPAG